MQQAGFAPATFRITTDALLSTILLPYQIPCGLTELLLHFGDPVTTIYLTGLILLRSGQFVKRCRQLFSFYSRQLLSRTSQGHITTASGPCKVFSQIFCSPRCRRRMFSFTSSEISRQASLKTPTMQHRRCVYTFFGKVASNASTVA